MDTCSFCGFEYDLDEAPAAGGAIVEGAHALGGLLRHTAVRSRPTPETWSPLEYACHVRDVLLVQRERVLAARREDRPSFAPMGRDERVGHDGYAQQDPEDVARQLGDAAHLFANVVARLEPTDWDRTIVYNYPHTTERPLRWVAVHTLHEVRHHLLDVRHQIA